MTLSRREAREQDGLTLVEVVMSVGVLSVILLGMFSAMASAQRTDALTRERAAASEAAFNMLDAVLSGPVPAAGEFVELPFNVEVDTGKAGTLPVLRPANPFPTSPWTFIGQPAPSPVMQAGIAVARVGVDDGNDVDLMEVRVLVAWRAADDTNQRIELVSRRLR